MRTCPVPPQTLQTSDRSFFLSSPAACVWPEASATSTLARLALVRLVVVLARLALVSAASIVPAADVHAAAACCRKRRGQQVGGQGAHREAAERRGGAEQRLRGAGCHTHGAASAHGGRSKAHWREALVLERQEGAAAGAQAGRWPPLRRQAKAAGRLHR